MTRTQKIALAMMADRNIGSILVQGFGWVWPTNIRNDGGQFGKVKAQVVAERIVAKLMK